MTDSYVLWLNEITSLTGCSINTSFLHDYAGLLANFHAEITGFVAFNPQTESVNAALTYCAGAAGSVIAVGDSDTAALLTRFGVPKAMDLTNGTVAGVYTSLRLHGNLVISV